MITIRSSADMGRALASPLDADLLQLLALRRDQLLEHDGYDLGELAHFIVAEPGDALTAIETAAGVPLATNMIDGSKQGDPDFTASFEYVERHGSAWFEAVTIVSDDGFGIVLLVPDRPDIDPALLGLVRDHAWHQPPTPTTTSVQGSPLGRYFFGIFTMLHFYDRAGFARALTLGLDPNLHRLLAKSIEALTEDLIDYTEYLVVQSGDTEADVIRHIGLSPLIEPMDGIRFGEPGFRPHWDWLEAHCGWFEMIFTFGSTFAYVVFVEDREGVTHELLTLCRTYADKPAEST